MFAPFSGLPFGLTFFETALSAFSGGIISSAFFYFAGNLLLKKIKVKNNKKVFTRVNRFIVSVKQKLGKIGIAFYAPLFLSIPFGSYIVARFYGSDKWTFFYIMAGMAINSLMMTSIAYAYILF